METLVAVALIVVCMAALTAMYLRLTARSPEILTVPTTDDIDGEFFRIIGREWDRKQDRNA